MAVINQSYVDWLTVYSIILAPCLVFLIVLVGWVWGWVLAELFPAIIGRMDSGMRILVATVIIVGWVVLSSILRTALENVK